MPKNIILCSDGTGNSDIKGRGTNVFTVDRCHAAAAVVNRGRRRHAPIR